MVQLGTPIAEYIELELSSVPWHLIGNKLNGQGQVRVIIV